jgi:nuclear pore complex protein Nup62
MNFLCVKVIYNSVFVKCFVVFYHENSYICVIMTCSTSYCLYDTLMDPWNVDVYVCMYVRTYVCMYTRMYACVYILRMYEYVCMYIYICMYVYMYVCLCVYVYIYVCEAAKIKSTKNSNDPIGKRKRDLPACSTVPRPTAPPLTNRLYSTGPKHYAV